MRAYQLTEKLIGSKEYKYALFSDLHIDSPEFQKGRLLKDLQWCKDNDCRILINGDTFDAILLMDKKRATVSRMETEDGQLNEKMDRVFQLLKPFANNICFIGRGNHEESVMKYNGVDVIQWLLTMLNMVKTNGVIAYGGYQTFLRIGFQYGEKKVQYRLKYDMFIHHGGGGNSPVTKGMIDFSRMANSTLADLYWIGHKHNKLIDPSIPLKMINDKGNIITKNRQAIMTPSYTAQIKLDNDLHFADGYYGVQASSGFGLLTLKVKQTKVDRWLEVDLQMKGDDNPIQEYGEVEEIL